MNLMIVIELNGLFPAALRLTPFPEGAGDGATNRKECES